MSRGKRTPTHEELALWEQVTDSVAPLTRRPPKVKRPPAPAAKPAKAAAKAVPSAPAVIKPKLLPRQAPALNPFDRRTLSRIGRGTVSIDGRIDLHGMTQDAAESALMHFLDSAQARGAKLVLVITGKGKPGGGERGVLRRVVPHWLSAPKLRRLVVGFDEAGPTHGGSGALYVRIRKAGRGNSA